MNMRIYDPGRKSMSPTLDIAGWIESHLITGHNSGEVEIEAAKELINNHYIYMLGTGIKDRNKVEVFDNDIVRGCFESMSGGAYTKFQNFRVGYVEQYAAFHLFDLDDTVPLYPLEQLALFEVIGDVFQNPELVL